MEDKVVINDTDQYLRNDGTIYLGMTTWWRPVTSKRWRMTDNYGRAELTPGMRYDTMTCPEGSAPSGAFTLMEKIRTFFIRML